MKLLYLTLSSILCFVLLGCSNWKIKNGIGKEKVTIQGIALHAKGGAVVHCNDSTFYYIDELLYWEDAMYKKKISVTGKLDVVRFEANPDTTVSYQYIERMQIIRKPKVSLIESEK